MKRSPWSFVPTLYFAEGMPYVIINTVSVILYKRLGVDNTQIAFWTGFLYLPWVIKMFWGPWVDLYSTKRNWILFMQFSMFVLLACAAFSLQSGHFFAISLILFTLGAFISGTHDIAVDGFYMLALSKEDQALFVGIRSLFYRIAMIFGSGFLVYFAGRLELSLENIPLSWTIALGFTAAIFMLIFIYHRWILPFPSVDVKRSGWGINTHGSFFEIIRSYFRQDRIWAVVAFILLYRLGEAMLVKMAAPFLLDKQEVGGLAISTSQVGIIYGTVGILALIFGGILGGWLISRYGLRKCIWPMALALNMPDLLYVYMAYAHPPLHYIYPMVALEQFGYGLGYSAFTVFLMYVSRGENKTSHFAISTGLMALGMMLPGMISGYLQKALEYPLFFVLVCLLTIPGMLAIFFIPLEGKPVVGRQSPVASHR